MAQTRKAPVARIELGDDKVKVERHNAEGKPEPLPVTPKPEEPKEEPKAEPAPAPAVSPWMAWLSRNFPGHEHAAMGGICGLVIALLLFVIGVWRTLLIALLMGIGVAVGLYVDGDERMVAALRSLLGGGSDRP